MTWRYPWRLLLALLLVAPSAAAQLPSLLNGSNTQPMTLCWRGNAAGQWRQGSIESTFVDYMEMRFSGSAEHAGIWVTPTGWVYFDEVWFSHPEVPAAYKHPSLREPQPFSISGLSGPNWRGNARSAIGIIDRAEVFHTATQLTANPTVVYEACQPVYRPLTQVANCDWQLDYQRWSSSAWARQFWGFTHRNPSSNTILTIESWVKQRIWLQTEGAVNPIQLFADPIFQLVAPYALHMNIQGLMIEGDQRSPGNFPTAEPPGGEPPPPGVVGPSAIVTLTSSIVYSYTGSSGERRDYVIPGENNVPIMPYVRQATVMPGQAFPFSAINITPSSYALLEIAGRSGRVAAPLATNPADPLGYILQVPNWLPSGTQATIAAFETNGLVSPAIPPLHRDSFTVQ